MDGCGSYDIGAVFPGTPYRIDALLGEGVMGEVYRATDSVLRRTVVLKILKPTKHRDSLGRMRREAQVIAGIRHPSLVVIYGFGESSDRRSFIAMEFLEGMVLRQYLRKNGAMPGDLACRFAAEALCGLHAAHQQEIIHRDVKPENLLQPPINTSKCSILGLRSTLATTAPI